MNARRQTKQSFAAFLARRKSERLSLLKQHCAGSRDGFTLTEVLVVVVILVVLAAIAVALFMNQTARAQSGTAKYEVSAGGETLTRYMSETGQTGIRREDNAVLVEGDTGTSSVPTSSTAHIYVWVSAGVEDMNQVPDGTAYEAPTWWCVEKEGGGDVWSMTPDNSTPVNAPCDLSYVPAGGGGGGGGGGGSPLAAPEITATSGVPDSIPVSWASVPDATSYTVTVNPAATVGSVSCVGGNCTTLIVDAENGTEYTVEVVAEDATRTSAPDSATATPDGNNPLVASITGFTTPQGVAVSPDGAYMYVGQNNGTVHKVDLFDDTIVASWNTGITNIFDIAVSSDGSKIYVPSTVTANAHYISIRNAVTGTQTGTIPIASNGAPRGVDVYGNTLYVTHNHVVGVNSNRVSLWNATTGASLGVWTGITRPRSVSISPDGTRAYVGLESGVISVRDTSTGSEITSWGTATTTLPAAPSYTVVSHNGNKLYVISSTTGTVKVLKTSNGTPTATWTTPGGWGIASSSCSETIYYSSNTGNETKKVSQVNQCS